MTKEDFLFKTLVRSFDWTDFGMDRYMEKSVFIDGREYIKTGDYTSTTVVGNLFKVHNPDANFNKYILCIGVARQHPNDLHINRNEGVEIAHIKSLMEPSIQMEFDHEITWEEFKHLVSWYVWNQNKKFVKTKEEITPVPEKEYVYLN